MVDTNDQWIVERTGIRERRIASAAETAAVMGAAAARAALDAAGLTPQTVGAVICATTSAAYAFPSCACEIAAALGITGVPAFDVAAACAGFSYAYGVAHAMICAGGPEHVLVVGTDRLSHCCDPRDRGTIILFGDGAGAVVLSRAEQPGTMAVRLSSDPQAADLLRLPAAARDGGADGSPYLYMKGNEVFRRAVTVLAQLVTETLAVGGVKPEELDFLVPHQANLRIIVATARRLRLDLSQVIVTVDRQGNTSSASVPLALHAGIKDGRIRRGQLLLMESFGGGFAWGAALVRY